ncbi:RNA polymerase sigma factor, TIGR02999 family [Dokdonella immobilis]|uniref:RNA polymerase sigma factor, TIGR02999 family n=2 Tax=Dokdonella immobilis TaxID=578942 RepID=A0A1I4WY06_9GAMM|nr:RNA polymerase sigma factor, TIGR02999 family [Dokdonella immobilis]
MGHARMQQSGNPSVTQLIAACGDDDDGLLARVFPLVYAELKQIAHRALLRASGGATLSTTALVNEAYLKLAGHTDLALNDRSHLFALCARAMRQIVVDHARRHQAEKRGGQQVAMSLTGVEAQAAERPETIVALDEALTTLAERDPRLVRIIEYRVFGGLDTRQIADLLELTPRSIQLEWLRARAWIGQALALDEEAGTAP